MCERSPLGLPHTQISMPGCPRVAEILLMSSPHTPRVCGDLKSRPKFVGSVGQLGANFLPPNLINTYHVLVQSIKSLDERKDVKGKDTFSLPEWWRCNSGNLPHFAFVLRALLTNAPNSCPPERLFSMFNATFGEDQKRAFGDYLELAMQSQYNKRNL